MAFDSAEMISGPKPEDVKELTNYGIVWSCLSILPGIGPIIFIFNKFVDDENASRLKFTPELKNHITYYRWRDLTISLALTAAILLIIAFAPEKMPTDKKVILAISGILIGGSSFVTGVCAYRFRKKSLKPIDTHNAKAFVQ